MSKILAIDTGRVRVGLAISDIDRKFAFPLATYTRFDSARDAVHFRAVVAEERPGLLLVGLPLHNDGSEGESAVLARKFGDWLAALVALPVRYYDERFTTVEAESILWGAGLTHRQRKERRDKLAAQILLQTFIEAGCPMEEPSTKETGQFDGEAG